jgi:hypothetical protein
MLHITHHFRKVRIAAEEIGRSWSNLLPGEFDL